MNSEGWKGVIKTAQDNPETLELLAQYLSDVDEAKTILGEKGYRVSGQPLLHVVKTLPHYDS